MGASLVYLEKPNKDIEWASGEDEKAVFACGEMQGWRLNMVSVLSWETRSELRVRRRRLGQRWNFGAKHSFREKESGLSAELGWNRGAFTAKNLHARLPVLVLVDS